MMYHSYTMLLPEASKEAEFSTHYLRLNGAKAGVTMACMSQRSFRFSPDVDELLDEMIAQHNVSQVSLAVAALLAFAAAPEQIRHTALTAAYWLPKKGRDWSLAEIQKTAAAVHRADAVVEATLTDLRAEPEKPRPARPKRS
jgi:hypothetical protein